MALSPTTHHRCGTNKYQGLGPGVCRHWVWQPAAPMRVGLLRNQPKCFGIQPTFTVAVAAAVAYVGVLTNSSGTPALLVSSLRHGKVSTLKQSQPLKPSAGSVAQLRALPNNCRAPFWPAAVSAQSKGNVDIDRQF